MVYFWSHVDKHRPDWSFVMSSLLAVLLADKKTPVPPQASKMRGIGTGGASIDGPMIARFESRFGTPIRTVYGLTETSSIATCEFIDPEPRSLGSSGRPLPVCEVRIDSGTTADSPSTPGAHVRGEIIIRGPTVFEGYVADPELTQTRKRDGWLRTGDVGYFDANGNLFVVDRLDSMLIVSGENVYPAEVERLCASLPGAAQIVLAGVNHPIWGTELVLVYRTVDDVVPQTKLWQRILADEVTGFKLPKRYVPLSDLGLREFPTTSNGKLDRRKIAALTAAKVAQ
jgi:acyl-CoA synthetase (AMP-forming)/AMP-acid ligase II